MDRNMRSRWVGAQVKGEMLGQTLDRCFGGVVSGVASPWWVGDPLLGAGHHDGLGVLGL